MVLSTGVIGSVISKLTELLKAEYNLQSGVKEQVKSLTLELEAAQAFLQKIDNVPPDRLDTEVKDWAKEVREESYGMDDVLDTFLVRVVGAEPINKNKLQQLWEKVCSLLTKTKARHDIGEAIKKMNMNNRVKEIDERRCRYEKNHLGEHHLSTDPAASSSSSSTMDPRTTLVHGSTEASRQLIGIDERMLDLVKKLSQDDSAKTKRQVVSLLGSGGVGKTTLAKSAYDQLMKQEHVWGAFVSVGRNPDFARVFKDILFGPDKQKCKVIHSTQRGADSLSRKLRKFLRHKRYLIVLDDVWENESRNMLTNALPDKKNGSKVIITTRNSEVAAGEKYKVEPLSHDNSEKLFYKRIFPCEDKCPDNQRQEVYKAAQNILRKCAGVPLAIITMARLLASKSMEEWSEVCNSIDFHGKENDKIVDTMRILSLSYYALPSHLKTCLLYMSVFPEDYLIRKDRLIWMWIAEGFVNNVKSGIGLFEIGEGYFNDLINRNLIQPVEEERSRIIKGCLIHDMILELICSLSREANFAIVSGNGEDRLLGSNNAHRLSLQSRVVEDTPEDKARARSFIAFGCSFGSWFPLKSFKLLRVLYLEDCNLTHFDKRVGDLLHLRYLWIRVIYNFQVRKEIGALKIGALKFLRVLFIDLYTENTTYGGIPLPSSVGMLTQLVCLRTGDMSPPCGTIKYLTSLQELQISLAGEADKSKGQFVKDLANLCELRVLKVFIFSMDERLQLDLLKSLGKLHKLQHLELGRGSIEPNEGRLPSFIDDRSILQKISSLNLDVRGLGDQGLQMLGEMPNLCYLELYDWDGRATITGTANQGYFKKLRSCWLKRSMIQFVVNGDSSVSFTMWDSKISDYYPSIDSKMKQDTSTVARTVMPNLEALSFQVVGRLMSCENGSFDCLGLEGLASLQKVTVGLDPDGVPNDVVRNQKAALSNAIHNHPNRPTLQIKFWQ